MRIRLVAACAAAVLLAGTAGAATAPPPRGLPLPTGMTLLSSQKGTSQTAFTWTATYRTRARVKDMNRYRALLERRGFDPISGPGVNLTFAFRRWQVFACADPGCSAPRGRFTLVVAIPGG